MRAYKDSMADLAQYQRDLQKFNTSYLKEDAKEPINFWGIAGFDVAAAYSEAIYEARGEAREQNEPAATRRAQSLARQTLGEADFTRLHREGAALRDAEAGAVAFGVEDVG